MRHTLEELEKLSKTELIDLVMAIAFNVRRKVAGLTCWMFALLSKPGSRLRGVSCSIVMPKAWKRVIIFAKAGLNNGESCMFHGI